MKKSESSFGSDTNAGHSIENEMLSGKTSKEPSDIHTNKELLDPNAENL